MYTKAHNTLLICTELGEIIPLPHIYFENLSLSPLLHLWYLASPTIHSYTILQLFIEIVNFYQPKPFMFYIVQTTYSTFMSKNGSQE